MTEPKVQLPEAGAVGDGVEQGGPGSAQRAELERPAAGSAQLQLRGFEPPEAAWRFLRARGLDASLQAFRETHASSDLVETLEAEGIQARPAAVSASDLVHLEVPTFVQLQDSTWILLLERRNAFMKVEDQDGLRSLPERELAGGLSGQVLDLSPSLPAGRRLRDRLLPLLTQRRRTLTQLVLASAVLQGLAILLPELTGAVMDRALPDGAGSLLRVIALGVVLVAACQAWTGWIRDRILLFLITHVEVTSERGFLEHLLKLPFPFLQKKTLGELLQAFSGLAMARELLVEKALGALLDGILAPAFLLVMALQMPLAALLVLLASLLMAGLTFLVGRAQARQAALEAEALAKERGYLMELISGIGTVKAAGAERRGLSRWLRRFRKELDCTLARGRIGLWTEVGLDSLRQALLAILLVWGGYQVLAGAISLGTLFAFLQLSTGFLGAVSGILNTSLTLMVLRPQVARVREILEVEPEKAVPAAALTGPIIMQDVWFRYTPEGPWILQGYDLRVEAGERRVLEGPSGSGKSTLLRLLAGLEWPERGSIIVGGLSPQAARKQILYLPQFVRLYGGSILENLRVLSGGAPRDRLLEASEATGLRELVDALPMGYHTILPHGGRNLSGGQRQLIALTAALASNRPLALLDEAMANLDPVRAATLSQALKGVQWTQISVAHE